jgi:hypothetical protein
VSIPHIAALNNPTDDITENRPPTPLGTSSVRYPSADAMFRSVPPVGSVVAMMFSAYFFPSGGLGGFARLADDVDDRLLDLRRDQVDHRADLIRIDVVQHE